MIVCGEGAINYGEICFALFSLPSSFHYKEFMLQVSKSNNLWKQSADNLITFKQILFLYL